VEDTLEFEGYIFVFQGDDHSDSSNGARSNPKEISKQSKVLHSLSSFFQEGWFFDTYAKIESCIFKNIWGG